jgi:hypothetical protein
MLTTLEKTAGDFNIFLRCYSVAKTPQFRPKRIDFAKTPKTIRLYVRRDIFAIDRAFSASEGIKKFSSSFYIVLINL